MLVKHDAHYFQHDTDETLIPFLLNMASTEYRFRIYIDLPDVATYDEGCIASSGGYRHRFEIGISSYSGSYPRPLMHSSWNHVIAVIPSSIAGLRKHHPGWITTGFREWHDKHWAQNPPYSKQLEKWIFTGENVWHGL